MKIANWSINNNFKINEIVLYLFQLEEFNDRILDAIYKVFISNKIDIANSKDIFFKLLKYFFKFEIWQKTKLLKFFW